MLDARRTALITAILVPAYEEPEGIYPDGRHTLVESARHGGGGDKHMDIYKLKLDGSGKMERFTHFSDTRGYRASNPVVSDDGRFITFQIARSKDMPGVGRGLFLYEIVRAADLQRKELPNGSR